jgi:hypothetical protein
VISKGIELAEGEKVEAFENLKVFQVWKEVRKIERELQQLLDQRLKVGSRPSKLCPDNRRRVPSHWPEVLEKQREPLIPLGSGIFAFSAFQQLC